MESDETWEPLASHYRRVVALFGASPVIRFNADPIRAGSTKLEVVDSKLLPVVILGLDADPLETLITLNHELTHAVDLAKRQKHLGDSSKLADCVSRYQLLTLEDETPAFHAELQFWKAAPPSFRDHFKGRTFVSRLLERSVDYQEYYVRLEALLAKEPQFVLRRYVEMGESPRCVLNLIKRASKR